MILGGVESVSSLPPVLQLGIVGFLGAFSALSVAARCWPRLGRRVWDPEKEPDSFDHLAAYTLVPVILFLAALATVFAGWKRDRPLLDGMSPPVWLALDGLILSLGLMTLSQVLKRRMDLSDGRKLSSWIPLVLFLVGLGLMMVSGQRLHRLL